LRIKELAIADELTHFWNEHSKFCKAYLRGDNSLV